MSDEQKQIDDGGPAYPLPDGTEYVRDYHPGHGETSRTVKVARGGLTMRDYFAAKAMQGVIGKNDSDLKELLATAPGGSDINHALNLSVRARKGLFINDIYTIEQLCSKTDGDLLQIRRFGRTSLREVKRELAKIGRTLAEKPELAPASKNLAEYCYQVADAMLKARKQSESY